MEGTPVANVSAKRTGYTVDVKGSAVDVKGSTVDVNGRLSKMEDSDFVGRRLNSDSEKSSVTTSVPSH
eukprot:553283-Prorocentrum_minimum.AAC.1